MSQAQPPRSSRVRLRTWRIMRKTQSRRRGRVGFGDADPAGESNEGAGEVKKQEG